MKTFLAALLAMLAAAVPAQAQKDDATDAFFKPSETRSNGSVTIGGARIAYQAIAGTLVVHAKDWQDTDAIEAEKGKADKDDAKPKPEASMFYTAYFRTGAPAANRPITFVFNGGPGSSSIWLHMGAFGPVRVETPDLAHAPAAPYALVNNDQSLLDVSDLVFIDAPGTGFSRVAGDKKEEAFYGVDQDIHAFAEFIGAFLDRYQRWNSPKYVLGESYGTMRGAGLALALQQASIDLNGVILLSDILNWDLVPDDPQVNPAIDAPYVVALPTYAATAWYHHRLASQPPALRPFLDEVEAFATGDYALALMQGNSLPLERRQAIAAKLAGYTGLSEAYLLRTNLRIEYGAFQKELMAGDDRTTGTLDTRFTGWTIDALSKVASYDPQGSALESAYVAAFNAYARGTLGYGEGMRFKPGIDIYGSWDYKHQPPGAGKPLIALPNVLPDLAVAMKQNPNLKVMVNGGYFDVSTPYFAGRYEMRHLPVPPAIAANVEYHYYESGHMVYVNPAVLKAFRADVADFIRRTDNLP
ncbi:peptidase S10 [Sphingomonas sp.]|uniref:S10 family peptidase n=1 Tax=Sphingomonas sp. TaxID=28214 RepID=UPI001B04E29C|nr:peptidase S10 [Sphingomonas sp.]MBO9712346.1 peptidase S10 [Sphingomonas sp.]